MNSQFPIQHIRLGDYDLDILRLDNCFGNMSGNKYLKLQYLLPIIRQQSTLVSFGGAHSNHLYALAHLTYESKVACHAIIRGNRQMTPTLDKCKHLGMELTFWSRSKFDDYIASADYTQFTNQGTYVIPFGGSSMKGIQGVASYFDSSIFKRYSSIICSVGTGTTICGIATALPNTTCVGIVSHHDQSITTYCKKHLPNNNISLTYYHKLKGFGRITPTIINYANDFYRHFQIPLDLVYTVKSMHYTEQHIVQLAQPTLFIHTGGLQGNVGYKNQLIY